MRVLLRRCHMFRHKHMKISQMQERTNFNKTCPLPTSNSASGLNERFKFRAPIQCDCADIDVYLCETTQRHWRMERCTSSVLCCATRTLTRLKSVNTRNRIMQLTKGTTTQIMTRRIPHRILCYRRSPRNSGRFKNDATKIK